MHVRRETDHMWPHHYTSRAYDSWTGDHQTEGGKTKQKNWKKKKKNKKSIVGNVQIYKLDWPSVNERLELRRTTKSSSNSENSLTCWSLCVSSIVSRESFGDKQRNLKKGQTQKMAIAAERADVIDLSIERNVERGRCVMMLTFSRFFATSNSDCCCYLLVRTHNSLFLSLFWALFPGMNVFLETD